MSLLVTSDRSRQTMTGNDETHGLHLEVSKRPPHVEWSLVMKIAIAALLSSFLVGCLLMPVDDGDAKSQQASALAVRQGARNAIKPTELPALIADNPDTNACVTDGCPDGLTCDWLQGCVAEVTFCCGDSACPDGHFCDFNSGATCQPK